MSHNAVANGRRSFFHSLSVSVLVVAVIGAGIMAWVYAQDGFAQDKVAPAAAPAIRRIHALGRLEPRGTVLSISAPSGNDGATVEKMLVTEGQDVSVGELLAVLDVADRRQAAVSEAEARWNVARAGLDQIRAGAKAGDIGAQAVLVRKMDTELIVARKELERARRLASKQALPEEAFDQKQLAFDRGELECQRARAQLESLREVRAVDVRLQEMEVAVAASSLARAKAEFAASQVRSQVAGRVLKIHSRPGERISDRGILQIGDVTHMQAVAEIFEGDLQSVRVGQPAFIRLTSTGEELVGKVEHIGLLVARKDVLSNDPVSDTDARVLEVRVNLDPADIRKVERMSNARVEVAIDLGEENKTDADSAKDVELPPVATDRPAEPVLPESRDAVAKE